MSGGSNIRAIGPTGEADAPSGAEESADSGHDGELLLETRADGEWAEEWQEDDAPAPPRFEWLLPALAVLAIAAWTAFFGWANQRSLAGGGTPSQWSEWIVAWSVPVLLVIAVWLLAMRHSQRETNRFGDAARMLRRESRELEARLITVNRELSLARDFLAAQSRDVESLGRVAVKRLSENAERLEALIGENGERVETIARVSTTALENMGKLRDDLPVVANSARDVTNQIGNAGRTAHGQLAELASGFAKLNRFGEASERQVAAIREQVDTVIAGFEEELNRVDGMAQDRFAVLRGRSEEFRTELDAREVDALAALGRRVEQLSGQAQEAADEIDRREEETLGSLQARIKAVREGVETVGRALAEGEERAATAWRAQAETMKASVVEGIHEVAALDQQAKAECDERLRQLSDRAAKVDARLTESHAMFVDEIERRQAQLDAQAEQGAAALAEQLAAFDRGLEERRAAQVAGGEDLARQGDAIVERLTALGNEIERVAALGQRTEGALAAAIGRLGEEFAGSRSALEGTDVAVAELTNASVRLLELIQGAARQSREDLPRAIGQADQELTELQSRADDVKLLLEGAANQGAALSDYVLAADERTRGTLGTIEGAQARIGEIHEGQMRDLETMRSAFSNLSEETGAVAVRVQDTLRDALAQLEGATKEVVASLEHGAAANVSALADRIGEQSGAAIERALDERSRAAVARLEEASERAAETGRAAAAQLRDQLAKVNELTGNLENRVARARERAEDQVDNDFSRRVALITEALNSNAIDIAKALSTEVTDTAWAAYLRGDRGIFTRRAVRLIDNVQARDIAETYDNDPDFREHVSRYIHDFEAMLRTMLSTRDGNALGVTLLSSDMGKLYVALAQAIERLRAD